MFGMGIKCVCMRNKEWNGCFAHKKNIELVLYDNSQTLKTSLLSFKVFLPNYKETRVKVTNNALYTLLF